MLEPPQLLHWLLLRLCSQMLEPPQLLHLLLLRLCSQMPEPPHSRQKCFCRLWGHFLRIPGIFKCFVLFAASCRRASLSEKQQEAQSTCEKQQEAQSEKQALTSNKHLQNARACGLSRGTSFGDSILRTQYGKVTTSSDSYVSHAVRGYLWSTECRCFSCKA